jgi:hypothetical protein
MVTYGVRQAQRGGKDIGVFRYVVVTSNGTWPVGYCNPQCDHKSPAEARDHYKMWLLEHARLRADRDLAPCHVCRRKTPGRAELLNDRAFALCDQHRNQEVLEAILSLDGDWVVK